MAVHPANLHEIAGIHEWALVSLQVMVERNGSRLEIPKEEYIQVRDSNNLIRQSIDKDTLIFTIEPIPEGLQRGVDYMYTPDDEDYGLRAKGENQIEFEQRIEAIINKWQSYAGVAKETEEEVVMGHSQLESEQSNQ